MADEPQGLRASIAALVERVMALKPVRVWQQFAEKNGPLLAGGLSYQALFAVFAAVWVGFAVGGLVLRGNTELSDAFFGLLATSVPGLIAWQGGEGIIQPEQLLELQVLGITGIIAAGALAFTAIGLLSSTRDAVRSIFDLPGQRLNVVLLKLKDAGLAVAFGLALLVSAALSVFSTQALDTLLGWLGVHSDSTVATIIGRSAGLAIMLVLDTAVLAGMYRVLSGLTIPLRRLVTGALLGAVGLGVLKVLGTVLLGGASRNPLLASFAILIGLLIWFNLVFLVTLVTASWIAVGMTDDGIAADPLIARERREAARLEEERIAAKLEADLRARDEAERASGNWFTRLLGRGDGGRR